MRWSKGENKHLQQSCCVTLTFVYVRRQTAYKHFAGEALNSLPILVGVTVRGAQDSRDTLVAVSVVKEIVINGEERRTACWEKSKHLEILTSCPTITHREAQIKGTLHTQNPKKRRATDKSINNGNNSRQKSSFKVCLE